MTKNLFCSLNLSLRSNQQLSSEKRCIFINDSFNITNRVSKGGDWKMQLVSPKQQISSDHFLLFLFNANISSSRMPIIADFIFWSVSSLFSTWPTESISKSS